MLARYAPPKYNQQEKPNNIKIYTAVQNNKIVRVFFVDINCGIYRGIDFLRPAHNNSMMRKIQLLAILQVINAVSEIVEYKKRVIAVCANL